MKIRFGGHEYANTPALATKRYFICPHPVDGSDMKTELDYSGEINQGWGILVKWLWCSDEEGAREDEYGCDCIPTCKAKEVITRWPGSKPPNPEIMNHQELEARREWRAMPEERDQNLIPFILMWVATKMPPVVMQGGAAPIYYDWGFRQQLKYKCDICGEEGVFAEFRIRWCLQEGGRTNRRDATGRQFVTKIERYRLVKRGQKEVEQPTECHSARVLWWWATRDGARGRD